MLNHCATPPGLLFLSETHRAGDWTYRKVNHGKCSIDTSDPVTFVWLLGLALREGSGTKLGSLNYLGIQLPISSLGCCAKSSSRQLGCTETRLRTSGKHQVPECLTRKGGRRWAQCTRSMDVELPPRESRTCLCSHREGVHCSTDSKRGHESNKKCVSTSGQACRADMPVYLYLLLMPSKMMVNGYNYKPPK